MTGSTHQLTRLMAWYGAHRDDEWEHHHGIRLEPLAAAGLEPTGWSLMIDTAGTEMAEVSTNTERIERSDTDWLQWSFEPGSFHGTCGRRNMNDLIGCFFNAIERLAVREKRR